MLLRVGVYRLEQCSLKTSWNLSAGENVSYNCVMKERRGNNHDSESESKLTNLQVTILAQGINWQREGTHWWLGIAMADELEKQGIVKATGRTSVYINMAKLHCGSYLIAAWIPLPSNGEGYAYHVTDEGLRERARHVLETPLNARGYSGLVPEAS